MSAPLPHPHRCLHVLYVAGRFICVSNCHYGVTVDLPIPAVRAA